MLPTTVHTQTRTFTIELWDEGKTNDFLSLGVFSVLGTGWKDHVRTQQLLQHCLLSTLRRLHLSQGGVLGTKRPGRQETPAECVGKSHWLFEPQFLHL